jgi:hypothetical protein
MLGLYTVAASLVNPSATAGTLLGLVTVGVVVAMAAWVVVRMQPADEDAAERGHLPMVGGTAIAGSIVALSGAVASLAAMISPVVSLPVTAALAGSSLGLALAALLCRSVPPFLPYVTAGVAGSATIAALASFTTDLPAGVYAATAALLGVLAELLRVRSTPSEAGWAPAAGWRPDRARVRTWRPVLVPGGGGFGSGVIAASAIPAALAFAVVSPALAAALLGPYRWVEHIWTATPATAASLGWYDRWAGEPTDVAAAVALTFAAALAAVGLGGSRATITARAVAVVIPGVAVTLLIAPAALHLPWPVGNTCTLAVAVLSGLGLALTPPPPDPALRVARRVIFVIGLAAGGAGLAGSLATRGTTVSTLAGTVFFGLIGALRGRTVFARMFAWQTVVGGLLGFAVAGGLAAGLPGRYTAFGVLVAAIVLIALSAVLPRLRRGDPDRAVSLDNEQLSTDAGGYLGLILAVGLTSGWPAYTAAALLAVGTVLGVSAIRPGRSDQYRSALIIIAAMVEVVAIWLLLRGASVGLLEAYTLPFAGLALLIGLIELRRRPDLGSWLAYGPALVAAFAPTLAMVLISEAGPLRRVLLIMAGVATVAIGSVQRHKASVTIGTVVTTIAAVHELFLLGQLLPWWVLLALFTATGAGLVALGATYERRSAVRRLRGAYVRFR